MLCLRLEYAKPAIRPYVSYKNIIIDTAINYFKANIFFREHKITGASDRTLIYIILYMGEYLRVIEKVSDQSPLHVATLVQCANRTAAAKELTDLALSHSVRMPREAGFPLNSMYKPAKDKHDEGVCVFMTCSKLYTSCRYNARIFTAIT